MANLLGDLWQYPLDLLVGIAITRAGYESHQDFQHLYRSSTIKRGHEVYLYLLYAVSYLVGYRVTYIAYNYNNLDI